VLFWVHAAVAYLVYRGISFGRSGRRPNDSIVIALVVGALLPDLVDKPLSFVFTSLPSRSVTHSIFIAAIVVSAVLYATRRMDSSDIGTAYVLGYASHLVTDLIDPLFIPEEPIAFLMWPILTDYHHIGGPGELLALVRLTPYVVGQTIITLLAVALWFGDGKLDTFTE